jgi:hypothetical protein
LNAFEEKIVQKDGFELWIQQLGFLLYKRFILFYRRYILAGIIIFAPILIEGLSAYLTPSQSYLVDILGKYYKINNHFMINNFEIY